MSRPVVKSLSQGDVYKIMGSLCRKYEKAMEGRIVVDIEVRLNLKRGGV